MNKERTKLNYYIKMRSIKMLLVISFLLVFGYFWIEVYNDLLIAPFYRRGNYVIIIIYTIIVSTLCKMYSGFQISIRHELDLIFSQFLAVLLGNCIIYVLLWILAKRLITIVPLLYVQLIDLGISICWSYIFKKWYFKTYKPRKSLVIYDEVINFDKIIETDFMGKQYEVVDNIHIDQSKHDFMDDYPEVETVFICGVHAHERNQIIKYGTIHKLDMIIIPRIGDVMMMGAKQIHLFNIPTVVLRSYSPNYIFRFIKRFFDIVISLLGIIVLSPIMIVLPFKIRKCDGGPALYRQTRLTTDGKEFELLKFRSMRMDAESDGVARLSTGDHDSRVTPIGKFMREHRLDELPQLFNILKGDMTIVGPRPERPQIAKQYEKTLPEFRLRLQAKAGLTGYAQVYGKYNTTPYNKLLLDLMYISNPSLVEDLKIILSTIKIIFVKDSTEGVDEGNTTAQN